MPDYNIRDFIYLDWEYIRSIASQLFEGVPEELSSLNSHEIGAEVMAKGKVPIFAEGQANGSYKYYKSENETKSLYRHIYSKVESELEASGRILKIDKDFVMNDWSQNSFSDGDFFIASGPIRVIDYKWTNEWISNYENIVKTVNGIERNDNKKGKALDSALKELKQKVSLQNLSKSIETFLGDTIRIKLMPYRSYSDFILTGYANREDFEVLPVSLYHKYGVNIDADWTVFGQINISSDNADTIEFGKIGNQIEDGFEEFILALHNMVKTTSAVKYPAISFNPISIYRTNNSRD